MTSHRFDEGQFDYLGPAVAPGDVLPIRLHGSHRHSDGSGWLVFTVPSGGELFISIDACPDAEWEDWQSCDEWKVAMPNDPLLQRRPLTDAELTQLAQITLGDIDAAIAAFDQHAPPEARGLLNASEEPK